MHALRTRFAPSPTGHLHLGHVAHLLYVWGIARAVGATIVLRMEDHDRTRCRPEYEQSIVDDLDWLGLHPDEGFAGHPTDAYRQSSVASRYTKALQQLAEGHLLYGCACTRSELANRQVVPPKPGQALPYDGFCRSSGLAPVPPNGIRLRLPEASVTFDDLLLGQQVQHPAIELGDPRLVDRNGLFTYQLCVVADDLAQDINLIIRGMDILPSTGTQLQLAAALGHRQPPIYLHHPLLVADDGQKLSKRFGSTALHVLRANGMSAAAVLGAAAYQVGLLPDASPISPAAIPALFAGHPAAEQLRQQRGC